MRRLIPPVIGLGLAAAAWHALGRGSAPSAAALLAVSAGLSLAVYVFAPPSKLVALRIGVHAGALAVAAGTVWRWALDLLARDPAAFLEMVPRLDLAGAVLALSPVVAALPAYALSGALQGLRANPHDKRQTSRSELYGRARLLARPHLRKLGRRRGILLGQTRPGHRAPLAAWALEGAALTVAPPRTGKGAQIAMNYLSPGDRGWNGSTVLVDPRGETYCIVARRRRLMGRRVVLLDPFGLVAMHAQEFGDACHLPHTASDRYNPLDWIRDDPAESVRDLNAILDALLTPPTGSQGNSQHFYESARALIGGYMAWVRFGDLGDTPRNLTTLHRIMSAPKAQRQEMAKRIVDWRSKDRSPCSDLAYLATQREAQVGDQEGGSNFTTIANQLSFLVHPPLAANVARSTFDPADLADGNVDLFIVVPEDMLEEAKGWVRLWITIPNAVASRRALKRDMLIMLDEMPRLGYLKPVMDAYNMAAGKGIHFWGYAQSLAALEDTWDKDKTKNIVELAEVFQVLGFPRTGFNDAKNVAETIGHATFDSWSEGVSGSLQESALIPQSQASASESHSVVKELLVTPDELMTMGPREQYIIAAPKDMPRDAIHLYHARYWERPDARHLADPNPFVIRKHAALANTERHAPPAPPAATPSNRQLARSG